MTTNDTGGLAVESASLDIPPFLRRQTNGQQAVIQEADAEPSTLEPLEPSLINLIELVQKLRDKRDRIDDHIVKLKKEINQKVGEL